MTIFFSFTCGTLMLCLVSCTASRSKYDAGFQAGSATALEAIGSRTRSASHRPLLAAASAAEATCGQTGKQAQYGTAHMPGGFINGMWLPPQTIEVVYKGTVTQPGCDALDANP